MPASDPSSDVLTLSAGGTRVELVPALGGKISSLAFAGREWLWTNDQLPRVAPTPAVADDDTASYVATADTGGYDECLPTVGACTVDVAGRGRVTLPDHGELWSQHAVTERLDAPAASDAAITRWTGRRLPYAFSRTVTVDADGAVRMTYELVSHGDAPIPFLWSAHPLLPFTPDTRLDLPVAARVRVWSQHAVDLGGEGTEHRWPVLRVGTATATRFGPHEVDFTFPARRGRTPTRASSSSTCRARPPDAPSASGSSRADHGWRSRSTPPRCRSSDSGSTMAAAPASLTAGRTTTSASSRASAPPIRSTPRSARGAARSG
jgi:hypothetical protein